MLLADQISKTYRRHANTVPVLQGLSLSVNPGEFLSIVGMSGSGKSTLLHVLGTLDELDSGAIYLDGQRIDTLHGKKRDLLRNRTFGFVFQFYHLLPELTVLDNVLMPAYISEPVFGWWKRRGEWRRRAVELLEQVGLGARAKHKPRELSGGEMQRTAVARALLMRPRILLADEPTGNLDQETGQQIIKLLKEINQRDRITIVMVTHNLEMAYGTHRVLKMAAGRLVEDRPTLAPPRFLNLMAS